MDHGEARDTEGAGIPTKKWTSWRAAVLRVANSEQRFVELKRSVNKTQGRRRPNLQ